MKKYIFMASFLGLVSLPKTNAQINTNLPLQASINDQNPFIDASSQSGYPSVGKGIVFPRTNLTTFKFKTDLFDGLGLIFPTAFDGMLVYNTHVEDNATIDDPATGTYTLDLKEGFYYFSNPNGSSGSLTGGRWKPLGAGAANVANFYSQNGTLSGNREVNLNNHSLNFTGGKVGINNADPKGTLDISYNSTWDETKPQGLNIPNLSSDQRSKFVDTKVGMLIYNTTKKCIEMYQGIVNGAHQWQCLPDAGSAQSQNIAVSPAGFEGQYIGGVALTNANKVKFKLQNNGFTAISNVDFSNAVSIQNGTGNHVQVAPNQNNNVSLASGAETTLTYRLTGTPETGNLTATFDRLGLQADQSIQVGLGSATMSNKDHYVVSMVYNSTTIQGKINNGSKKVTLEIPYTNGQGSYNAVNITQTSAPGQNNDINPLTLKIQPNTFNAAGNLTGTIEVGGDGEYLVRQLAPGATYDIATFNVDINGNTFQVVLKGIGGVPDKKFGESGETHNFVYLPVEVTAPNGYNKTWLNMNLGAEAAKVGSSAFNPTLNLHGPQAHQTQSLYGSLYQWQRPTDGHEFRTSQQTSGYANSWQATSPSGIVGKFIVNNNSNWVSNGSNDTSGANVQLWQGGKANNPCPTGYHVPTHAEWEDFYEAVNGSRDYVNNGKMWNQTLLPNFAAAGYRYYYNGSGNDSGSYGLYWSSESYSSSSAWHVYFYSGYSSPDYSSYRAFGFSVRCLKD